MDNNTVDDLGTMVLAQQTTLDQFKTLCKCHDIANMFHVPDLMDFSDHETVAIAPHQDLLSHYNSLSTQTVLQYQSFVNAWISQTNIESCEWALHCRGGLTLFKLLVDKLDAKTYKIPSFSRVISLPFALTRFLGKMWLLRCCSLQGGC